MPSSRLSTLQAQLQALREHLLPDPFEPTGMYEDAGVYTRSLAYRVLAHAEIEAFLEDRALEAVTKARAVWDSDRHVSRVVLSLVAFSGKEMALPPDSLAAPNDNKAKSWPALIDINERLIPILSAFHRLVRNDNHGIKERNLLSLFLPIGLDHQKLDPAFLVAMETFGSLRGQAAHTSTNMSVQQAVDPAVEHKRVSDLLPGLISLDTAIEAMLEELPAANNK